MKKKKGKKKPIVYVRYPNADIYNQILDPEDFIDMKKDFEKSHYEISPGKWTKKKISKKK